MPNVQPISDFMEEPAAAEDDPMARLQRLAGAYEAEERPRVVVKRAMPDKEVLAVMSGLGALLAVRLILALAVIGAFVLAYLATQSPARHGLWILVAYAVTVIFPLVYLSTKRT